MTIVEEDVDQFWKLIDRIRTRSQGDLDAACEAFREELQALDDQSLLKAELTFSNLMLRAMDYRVWDAAHVIHGGCGDDAFWDFRAGLVALGRKIYEAALASPDSLAEVQDVEAQTLFEGFQYVPGEVLEARGLDKQGEAHGPGGKEPTDVRSSEEELPDRFPRLWARFG